MDFEIDKKKLKGLGLMQGVAGGKTTLKIVSKFRRMDMEVLMVYLINVWERES